MITSMRDRGRYSRWALAGAALALLTTANYVIVGSQVLRGEVIHFLAVLPRPIAEPLGFAWLLAGPASIVLGMLARREIRRQPWLRGDRLAQIVVIAGWLLTVVTLLIIALAALTLWLNVG